MPRITNLTLDSEQEDDGRWLAEVPELPGVMVYADSRDEAITKAEILALRVLADRLEHDEAQPTNISIMVADVVFAFHDREEIGPGMLARMAKHTGLKPEDL